MQKMNPQVDKPHALLLVHRIPYPPDKGDKIRSWNLLKFLAERYQLSMGCFIDDKQDWQHTDFLKSLCADTCFVKLDPKISKITGGLKALASGQAMTFPIYDNAKMHAFVAKTREKNLEAEFVFSSSMAPYIEKPSGAKRFIDMVDADSRKWQEYAQESSFPMAWVYEREHQKLAQAEAEMTQWADQTFLITDEEASIIRMHPDTSTEKVDWWVNGVDTAYFDPSATFEPVSGAADIVFAGAMDYGANVDAVMWFTEKVWPMLKEDNPHLTFAIVGARPTARITKLSDIEGITVTGRVADMRPWLAQAKVVIAPLRIARGIQNKVLEAMAMARPIVATHEAANGIHEARHGETLMLAQTLEEMAAAIKDLLENPEKASQLGHHARQAAVDHYTWQARLKRLAAYL